MKKERFNYNKIPIGYYDDIAHLKKGMRSFWHNQKFERIISIFPPEIDSLLDIGCFSGTFLSMISENRCPRQVGTDILKSQIDYATKLYGSPYREFRYIEGSLLSNISNEKFSFVTMIEVIEHLTSEEIKDIFNEIYKVLKPGGKLIFSTPNYMSAWPLLELILNIFSDVKYEEQHLTKFTVFNIKRKLQQIIPGFNNMFKIEFKTTSHFISPYLALLSYKLATRVSGFVKSNNWKFPFGSLILVEISRI